MQIGIDLGGTKIEGALLGPSGEVRARHRIPTPRDDYAGTISAIAAVAHEMLAAAGGQATIGVGIPGSVSPVSGLFQNGNSTWLIGKRLDADLALAIGQPVRVANDSTCFALSEAIDGAAAGTNPVFGVILGTGVGGGIVIDGQVLTGANAIAGEWGHNPLPQPRDDERPGPLCYCGRHGCTEMFLSGPALEEQYLRLSGAKRSATQIGAAANSDAIAGLIMDRYCERLARALGTVINIIDPEIIVLGGGLSKIALLYDRVPPLLAANVFAPSIRTRIVPPTHGDSSGVRGAAWLWPKDNP